MDDDLPFRTARAHRPLTLHVDTRLVCALRHLLLAAPALRRLSELAPQFLMAFQSKGMITYACPEDHQLALSWLLRPARWRAMAASAR